VATSPALDLPFQKRTLSNGLDVIVHEDHHVPIVAVNIWYRVGSKDEHPGRTGFAHLFEHLMFEGSEHHDIGYFQPLQRAGALLNGSTNTDRTNYWEVVPTSALDLALWLESDRMGYLLPALTRTRFETQRDVVLNERRQSYENRPYGLAMMAMMAALFPPDHPYHWMTIGEIEDLRAMQFEDVRAFFQTYYHPGNASLALAGDIETERAFDLAQQYFGDLARGPEPTRPHPHAPPVAPSRLLHHDRVELPRLYMGWTSPAMYAPGDAPMDLVAEVLASGKASRLYRRLVYELRLALDVSSYQGSRQLGSYFLLAVTAAPGIPLARLADLVDEEIAAFATRGPDAAEMERVLAQAEAHFLYRLQSVGGFGGRSDQLNAYNVFRNDPGCFRWDLARYRSATAEALREAAAEYLRPDRRVLLSVVPRGQDALALDGSAPVAVS
jgi:zinc protease